MIIVDINTKIRVTKSSNNVGRIKYCNTGLLEGCDIVVSIACTETSLRLSKSL